MSDYTDQLADIVGSLEAITDIGRVYDHPRAGWSADLWVATVDGHPVIRAWEVGVSAEIATDRITAGHRSRFIPWRIQGYIGPVDTDTDDPGDEGITPGYTAALDLAEQIVDAIEADYTLGGTCLHIAQHGGETIGCLITPPTLIQIPGPLCWGVGIEFTAWTHPAG